jgi:site-specific DNA-methyltransferase (adenine-specific)
VKPYHETPHGLLYHGDCLEVMQGFAEISFDLCLTDPPYGTTACHWDNTVDFDDMWELFNNTCKPAAPMVFTALDPFSARVICSNIGNFRHSWVWDKVNAANFMNIKHAPLKIHEFVLVFCRSSNFTFNPQRVKRNEASLKRDPIGSTRPMQRRWRTTVEHYGNLTQKTEYRVNPDGTKHPVSIIKFSSIEKQRYTLKHPTKKPVSLFEYLVKSFSNESDSVFDPFAGSGTTAIACIRTNRKYVIIEKEEKYCEIAAKRIDTELEQADIFRGDI